MPVVTQSIALESPKETNQVRVTKPENVEISVSKDGDVYWGTKIVPDMEDLSSTAGQGCGQESAA